MYIQRKARTQATEQIKKERRKYLLIRMVPILICMISAVMMFDMYVFHDRSMYANVGIGSKIDAEIDRGDVIAFSVNDEIQIRRVIGLPGDSIEINYNTIYINGQECIEKYLSEDTYSSDILFEVPQDSYFVLADNRENYLDSRDYGFVSINSVIEKIIFIG